MTNRLIGLCAGALLLSACSLAPQYQQPATPEGAAWQAAETLAELPQPEAVFTDPGLQRLISLALENNRDLRLAALNVAAFEAQYRISRAALLPTLDASLAGSRQRLPADVSSSGAAISSQYSAGIGLTAYELDFFGRIRSLKDQALEQYLAQQQNQHSARIGLVSAVASAYLTLVADRDLLQLSASTLESELQSLALIEQKQRLGVASELELAQSRMTVESARASEALYQRQVTQDMNALTQLLGTQLPMNLALPTDLTDVEIAATPALAPSQLLQQRPDILAAEHQLRAANANIGAAKAALFPSISLTTSAGSLSPDLGGLFAGGSGTWLMAPSLNLPLFDGGQRAANVEVAKAQQEIAVVSYQQAIETAFREVADSLNTQAQFDRQLAAQAAQVVAGERYLQLADQRFEQGVDSYLTRLDAQRSLFSARQQLVSTHLAELNNRISLYKALGGG
uniref:efflux transporter outer membrane subunit n=1 Tax=Marinobacterium profundum TaxID=1714300 RepID=UPI00083182DF|nr:efflux transporter outer membrane subunit [Marinobacterium profundum]